MTTQVTLGRARMDASVTSGLFAELALCISNQGASHRTSAVPFADNRRAKSGRVPAPPEYACASHGDKLLMEHLPLVRSIASRIRRSLPKHVAFEDLLQSGLVGLLDAIAKYDPRRQVPFQGYATFRVRGAILDSLRELDWGPRGLRSKARQLEEAQSTLRSQLDRDPSELELAAKLGVKLSALQSLIGEIANLKIESLTPSPNGRERDLYACTPAKPEETPLVLCLRSETKRLLTRAVAELPPRQREVLVLYYGKELTMKRVGSALGIGESRVSQLHSMAVVTLRIWFSERTNGQAHSVEASHRPRQVPTRIVPIPEETPRE